MMLKQVSLKTMMESCSYMAAKKGSVTSVANQDTLPKTAVSREVARLLPLHPGMEEEAEEGVV